MRTIGTYILSAGIGLFATSAAMAACDGGLGRGWASGKGAGKYEMAAGDKTCAMEFPNFINGAAKTKTPANKVVLTRAPKSGKIGLQLRVLFIRPTPALRAMINSALKTQQMLSKARR